MDERQWSKARELADAFGNTSSESVAFVLGSALMEALSELLDIPLEGGEVKSAVTLCGSTSIDGHECSRIEGHTGGHHDKNGVGWSSTPTEPMSAKPNGSMLSGAVRPACELCGGDHRSRCSYCTGHHPNEDIHEGAEGRPYPEFLEGEASHAAAPVGTVVESINGALNIERFDEGWGWTDGSVFGYTPTSRRRVLQWGCGV